MIGWFVPHSRYPDGYHCDPKQPAAVRVLASQKNHMALYLFCIYCGPEGEHARFVKAWKATGKRLDMGKSCVRVKKLEDVPLDVVGAAIKRMTAKKFVAGLRGVAGPKGRPAAKKAGQEGREEGRREGRQESAKPAAKRVTKKVAK